MLFRSYEEVKEFIQNMKFNFNFFVVEDYYLGKVNTPFLFEEFLKVATTSFSCKKKIEIIIITDFNSNNIKLLYQNYSKLISKYIQKFKLLIVKPPTDNSIHDRRIWTNSRQFYSGMGFSGKDNKGFLKALHFSKSKFSKNPKIQFKNQYLHQKGISNLNKAIHDIKELIKKSENSTDGKVINYYPIDSDGSESVKHFNFLQNI